MRKTVEMTPVAPAGCNFLVGDKVRFTNEYGVVFEPYTVTGFTLPEDSFHGRCVYIDAEAYWFPHRPSELTLLSR